MTKKENTEKPDYLKYSKKELSDLFEYQFKYSDELLQQTYDLKHQIAHLRGIIELLKGDVLLLMKQKGQIISGISKDNNPVHEPILEYFRAGECRLN